jgi:hypothetical protein
MSMRKVLVLLAGLALIASVHATTGISGIVTNADNGHPILSARVCCRAESSRAYTDSAGFYLFSQLAPGTYTVTVGASGFVSDTYPEPVVVVDGQVTPDINFALHPVTPPPTGGISGHVTNAANGHPLRYAKAYACGAQGYAYTDSLGFYELDNLEAHKWMVHCGAEGFVWQFSPESVTVTAGHVTPNVDFALVAVPPPETGSISGRVVSAATQEPIYHAHVIRVGSSQGAYTDSSGRYVIDSVPKGKYAMYAYASGYVGASYPDSVPVEANHNTPNINFALVPASPPESTGVRGRITSFTTGAPIVHANVTLSGQSAVYTDANGVYYSAATAGWHNAWGGADGYLNGIYPESILVQQGAVRESINFVLIPTAGETGIGGRLTDASRMLGIGGGTVVASGPNGSGSATSVRTGGYLISDLPAGRYRVMAQAQGFQTAYSDSVTVVTGQVCWAPFYMQPLVPPPDYGSICGSVTNSSNGEIVYHAIVRAGHEHFYRQVLQTSHGYRIDSLPAGKYWVSASADGFEPGHYSDSVVVYAGQLTDHIDFQLEPMGGGQTGGISGLVTNSQTGEPIFGALVIATGPSQGYVNSNQDGEYVLHNLLPGTYLVMAVAQGFHPSAWDTVIVVAGEITPHIDFALEPMGGQGYGGISGVVRDSATQAGIPHARVFAWSPRGQGLTYADSSGNYEIDHLPVGNYILRASAEGYYPSYHMDSVEVLAGQVTSGIDFRLRHVLQLDAGIGGFVIDGYSQNEVAGAHVAATSSNGSYDAYCDGHGDYLLTGLVPGDYIVQVDASGYEPEVYPEPVTVTLGSVTCFVSPAMHTPTGTEEKPIVLPEAGKLDVAPNPFAVQALVRWQLPKPGEARVQMYDNSGRLVRTLVSMTLQPGSYSAVWDGKDNLGRELPSGAYFCRLLTAGGNTSRMIVLLR